MAIKKILFIILVALTTAAPMYAQTDSFCVALHTLIADAGNKFILTRGATIDVNERGIRWESKMPVPGMISARVISSLGLFYEGALYQTKSADGLEAIYDRYKDKLSACLGEQYSLTTSDNFNKGMEQYRKLVYMQPVTDASLENPPPHISMEVDYYKQSGIYTVLLHVWEH